jgi:DNA-binding NarL/FixJ family response regulator
MINLLVNCKEGNDEQLKVLIIEDCVLIGERLKELISANKLIHVLGQAKSVAETLRMFTALNPDLIFLDINLPDGNGIDTLVHLKRLAPSLKVIVFSNSTNNFYKRKFAEIGSDYFFDKSKDFKKIPAALNKIIYSKTINNNINY